VLVTPAAVHILDPLQVTTWCLDVAYHQPMPATPAVDRAEWSAVVAELLAAETRGNVAELARRLKVDTTTVRRWLAGSVAVSADSVHHVAATFTLPLGPLLVRVGYLRDSDLRPAPPMPDAAVGELAGALIAGAQVPPSVRRDLADYVARRRAWFDKQLASDVERIVAAEERAHRGGRTGR